MAVFSDVFERVEKKYMLDRKTREDLERVLSPYMCPDAYGRSCITSLYLDTCRDEVVCRSVEKPLYKEKIRLRAYGEAAGDALVAAFEPVPAHAVEGGPAGACGRVGEGFSPDGLVFCELKKKFKGVVYKRRVGLSLEAAHDYLCGRSYVDSCTAHPCGDAAAQAGSLSPKGLQISREIDAARRRYDSLLPRMAIVYYRTAWVPRGEHAAALGDLRITFDDSLRCKSFACPLDPWEEIVEPDYSVLEVKSSAPLPIWLADSLSRLGVFPRSFTKYGTAYTLTMGLRTEEGCAAKKEVSCVRA